jgi:hypothetical protein
MKSDITRILQALLLAAATLCACTRPPDYLFVDPRAQPLRVELRKPFGTMSPRYAPVGIGECVFYEAPRSGPDAEPYPRELWRVISVAPDRPAMEIRYGVLPPGFLQAVPSAAPAPPLLPGHHYTAECSGDTVGSSEFVIPEVGTRSTSAQAQPKTRTDAATRRPDDPRKRESRP